MGRDSGLIALRSGIGSGAEAILIPESRTDINALLNRLEKGRKDKSSKIIIVAEGDDVGGAFAIAKAVNNKFPTIDTKVSILGHMQRGGAPSCMDRVLASRLGIAAVEALIGSQRGEMIGVINGKIHYTPFRNAIKHVADIDQELLKIVEILSL